MRYYIEAEHPDGACENHSTDDEFEAVSIVLRLIQAGAVVLIYQRP